MTTSFKVYCDELQWRSKDELRRTTDALVDSEKTSVARLIAHLAEIARRNLHLEWGYKHLFDYCQRSLGLSEGSIALRIQVANVCRRFPEILCAIDIECAPLSTEKKPVTCNVPNPQNAAKALATMAIHHTEDIPACVRTELPWSNVDPVRAVVAPT